MMVRLQYCDAADVLRLLNQADVPLHEVVLLLSDR